ncbi:GNAT family N-acetyltransferase [Actinacidiphila glaucinigra]|uniref:GNAT family N-acetyltransferase n=1 Tax=Actinacidiphila glaucinigra TaxID=235986 RepID=UPI0033B0E6A3
MADQSEADSLYDLVVDAAPTAFRAERGISGARFGGGALTAMRNDPTKYWSKAVGFGHDEPLTADLVDEIRAFYRAERVASTNLYVAPQALPADWETIRAERGIAEAETWVKLAGDVDTVLARFDDPATPRPTLKVETVRPQDIARWGALRDRVFGLPEELAPVIDAVVGRDRWEAFALRDGEEIVGGAIVFLGVETAHCYAGFTAPEARGRGGQTALFAARAEAAKAAGCRWLVTETGAEGPGEHNTSLRNMRRLGFKVVYERRNWVLPSGL